MLTIDWIALGVILFAVLLGLLLGFGKCLKIFTGGIFGIIISIFVTYFLIGIVGSWGFVQSLLNQFDAALVANGSGFCTFLNDIGIESIVLAVALFIIVQLLRILIVNIIKGITEADNVVMRIINKVFGVVIAVAFILMLVLVVFQIVYLIGGDTANNFRQFLSGAFKIDVLFDNNPLRVIADMWTK